MNTSVITKDANGKVQLTNWLGMTLSGLLGFAAALVAVTLAFGDVRGTASAAQQRAKDNATDIDNDIRPRLRELEQQRAADREWRKNTAAALQRIEDAVRDR